MNVLYTNSLSNQNIAAYLEVGSYTAVADCQVMIRVVLDQVQGNGDYYAYATIDSAVFGPITKFAVPNAVTKIGFVAGVQVPLLSGETLKVYVKGLPADVATPDIVTEVFDLAFSEAGDAMTLTLATITSIATAVWTYATRTLTMSLASFLTALKGNDIAVDRGDTFSLNINGLGDLTGYTELWFTIKDDKDKTDAQSIIQVLKSNPGLATDGLQAIAGAVATTPANGSVTINNLTAGNITIRTEAVETAKLLDCGNFYYDIQKATATDVLTLRRGRATVQGDVTRSI